MSTQEKLHGLGLRVPEAYAGGTGSVWEGEGTAVDAKDVEEASGCVLHKPQVALQLLL
jgi:hypothetical protein